MLDHIHIYHNNQQEGPYSLAHLYDMIEKGTVTPVTLAWKDGMSEWAPLNSIISLPPSKPSVAPLPCPSVNETQPCVASPPVATGPKGVGGWLVFFCVVLTILAPLHFIGQFSITWEEAQPAFAQFPNIQTAIIWENAGSIALLIYGFFVGCMIWRGNPDGRKIAKKFLLVQLFGFIGIEFIAIVIMGDLPFQVVASVFGAAIGAILANLFWFLIWWFYFKKSIRVRNTYGEI